MTQRALACKSFAHGIKALKLNYKGTWLITLLICISQIGTAQTGQITIEFLGNCGLYITDGKTNIYTDFPYRSGAYNYMEYESASIDSIKENSIFIFTHKHADHYSKKILKRIMKEKGGQKYGVSNISDLEKLENLIEDFEIKAFKTKHSFFGIPFRHYSYLIVWKGKKIFLSGDTTNPDTIGEIKNMDWAFVPYWLYVNAADQKVEIDTEMLGIYHLYPQQIPSAKKTWDTIENVKPMVEQGEVMVIKL